MVRAWERVRGAVGEERLHSLRRLGGWATRSYIVLIALGILVGLQVAPAVSELGADPVRGTVAVIPLEGGIDGGNAASVVARLKQAREDPRIEAVVLQVNSGGGGASASEEIYMAVKRTEAQMPVVVSIGGIAASGAYYSSVPADRIYVKPASFVGSVGVIFTVPQSIPPIDVVITTGPNKLSGADQRDWYYKVTSAQRAFVGAVMEQRGDRMSLSANQLGYAKLYTGAEAVDNGLADDIGGLEDAIKRAATMAGLSNYRITIMGYDRTVSFVTRTAYLASDAEHREMISPTYFVAPPSETTVPNPLMLPPSVVRVALDEYGVNATTEGVIADGVNATQ